MPLEVRSEKTVSAAPSQPLLGNSQASCVGTAMTSQSHRILYRWTWDKMLVVTSLVQRLGWSVVGGLSG